MIEKILLSVEQILVDTISQPNTVQLYLCAKSPFEQRKLIR